MEEKRWAKKVFNWRKRDSKIRKQSNRKMGKINMKIIENRGNFEIKINEEIVNGTEKKIANKVKKEVKSNGNKKWKTNMEKKSSLKLYRVKERPEKDKSYNGTWEASLLFKARTNTLEVNERKKKWGGANDKCEKCEKRGERITETLEHVLTECSEYTEERNRLDEKITNKLGQVWVRRKMGEDRGLKTVLGLEDNDKEIVRHAKEFLREIWRKRNKKITLKGKTKECQEHNYTRRGE